MLTAQNKSVAGLTMTGSFYYAPSFAKDGVISTNNSYISGIGAHLASAVPGGININGGANSDAMVLWGDLAYNNADFPVTFGVQGGFIDAENAHTLNSLDKTVAVWT